MTRAGTPWVLKTPKLRCRCGTTLHMEMRGKWKIIYDSDATRATPTSTLSTPYDKAEELVSKLYPNYEPPERAEDDSDG